VCALSVVPAHSQPELAGHPVAPGHTDAETVPVTVPDGAGGAFVAFKAGPPIPGYATPSVYVAHVNANGESVSGWTPIAIGSLYTRVNLPPIMAPTSVGRVWLAPDFYFAGTPGTPYLMRAADGNGLTAPDLSQALGADYRYNSLAPIGPDRVLLASKFGPGGSGGLSLAILEPTGALNEVPAAIGMIGPWAGDHPDDERGPVLLGDGAGGAWVLSEFINPNPPGDRNIAAIRIAADGSPALSPPCRVVCAAQREQSDARLTLDDAGGVFIVWTDRRDLTKAADVFASHLLADGSLAPGVPVLGRAVASFAGDQFQPQIVSDANGGAWLAWTDSRSGENDIYYTHIGADCQPRPGYPAGGRALSAAPGSQIEPRLAADGEGGMYAVWLDRRDGELDLYGQHIHATGVVMPGWSDDGLPICTQASEQASPSVCLSSAHHAIATWSDTRSGFEKIYAAAMPEDGAVAGVGPSRGTGLRLASAGAGRELEFSLSASDAGDIKVEVFDATGRRVAEQRWHGPLSSERVRIPGEALRPGLYLARAGQAGATAVSRALLIR
jgi:hypothetical protein